MLDISTQLQDIMQRQQVDGSSALLILLEGEKDNEQSVPIRDESIFVTATETVR